MARASAVSSYCNFTVAEGFTLAVWATLCHRFINSDNRLHLQSEAPVPHQASVPEVGADVTIPLRDILAGGLRGAYNVAMHLEML